MFSFKNDYSMSLLESIVVTKTKQNQNPTGFLIGCKLKNWDVKKEMISSATEGQGFAGVLGFILSHCGPSGRWAASVECGATANQEQLKLQGVFNPEICGARVVHIWGMTDLSHF